MKVIAVAGGIGSGKSVVCKVLAVMGYEVYDCDSRAKRLMDESEEIKRRIREEICEEAIGVVDGVSVIDRRRLAAAVFADEVKLGRLNGMVHGAVKRDIVDWVERMSGRAKGGRVFVETAILLESGMDEMVDEVWEVVAPVELRIERAMRRDNACRDQIEARIRNQQVLSELPQWHPVSGKVRSVVNDGVTAVVPQLLRLLED